MVFADDFTWISFPNPYENLHEMEGFRARAPFWTKIPAGCSRIPRKRQQNKAFWAPHFPLFQESMRKTYIIVYVFWYFWSPFSWISCHTSKTTHSDRTGKLRFDGFPRLFRAPKTYKKRLRLCRVFERCFQESRFSRKWAQSAFSCSTAFRGVFVFRAPPGGGISSHPRHTHNWSDPSYIRCRALARGSSRAVSVTCESVRNVLRSILEL